MTAEMGSLTRLERFEAKVRRDDDGHWYWTAAADKWGYGRFWDGTRLVLAYRWAYEHFVGPIPDGLVIDHLCRIPACVNPAHLEPVTQGENTRRGVGVTNSSVRKKARTHCKNGHEYTPENTYNVVGPVYSYRQCRICAVESQRRWRDRRRR